MHISKLEASVLSKNEVIRPTLTRKQEMKSAIEKLADEVREETAVRITKSVPKNKRRSPCISRRSSLRYSKIRPTLDRIAEEECEDVRWTPSDMKGPGRYASLVETRRRFIERARETGASTFIIGRFLNRDHATIIHALNKINL